MIREVYLAKRVLDILSFNTALLRKQIPQLVIIQVMNATAHSRRENNDKTSIFYHLLQDH
jgi:hypothetical protein